jgi:hypothetical protein
MPQMIQSLVTSVGETGGGDGDNLAAGSLDELLGPSRTGGRSPLNDEELAAASTPDGRPFCGRKKFAGRHLEGLPVRSDGALATLASGGSLGRASWPRVDADGGGEGKAGRSRTGGSMSSTALSICDSGRSKGDDFALL